MPKIVVPLRDVKIAAAKPKAKDYSLADGGGLDLLVKTTGRKLWRYRYFRPDGRRNMVSFGAYPDVSLADARAQREAFLAELRAGLDPKPDSATSGALGASSTFLVVARAWLDAQKKWSDDHRVRVVSRFERHLFPKLGARPIESITAIELLNVLNAVEAAGYLDIASRMRQQLVLVFRSAVLKQLITYNPAQDLLGNFTNPVPVHRPALSLDRVPDLLARIDGYKGRPVTRFALLLSLHLFVRSSELRFARWPEVDFDGRLWTIPADRAAIVGVKYSSRGAKMRLPHLVPLSAPVMALFDEIKKACGEKTLILPGDFLGDSPISENTVNAALRRLGYDTKVDVCGHGFRSMACSALNESGLFSRDAIERQMSHQERDSVRAAYIHKAEFLQERRRMMDWWSAYLERCRGGYVPPWEFGG
jgi:integrase